MRIQTDPLTGDILVKAKDVIDLLRELAQDETLSQRQRKALVWARDEFKREVDAD